MYKLSHFIPDPKFFDIREFVSRDIFIKYGKKAWQFLEPKILISINDLRNNLKKPIIINNWHCGYERMYSGFREYTCNIGATNSPHRHGKALDFIVLGMPTSEVIKYIIKNQYLYSFITRIESKINGKEPSHIHIDCYNTIDNLCNIELFEIK